METKKTYIKPDILVEEWKFYKEVTGKSRYGHRIYDVSNFGRVKLNSVIIEPHTTRAGYKIIGGFLIHRAVAELFILNPDNKPQVDHIDTNPSNNIVWNLRWVTNKENNNNVLTRQHKSESLKGRKFSDEHKQNISKAQKEKKLSDEHKQKISDSNKDRIWVNKYNEQTKVKVEQLDLYLNNGWELGMLKRKIK